MMPEEAFVSFMQALPELTDSQDLIFSDEVLQLCFKRMDGKGTGELTQEEFLEQFLNRFICTARTVMTETLEVKGAKTLRKLEVSEVVEALGEPEKDEGPGLLRVRARAVRDDKEGFVTISGNQGTVFLERYSPYLSCQRQIDAALRGLDEAISQTSRYLDSK